VRLKVVLILVATLLVTLTASTWITYRSQQSATLEEIHQRNVATSDFIAKALAYHVIANDYHTLELLLRQVISPHGISHARVINSRGTVMAEQGRASNNDARVIHHDIKLNGERIGTVEFRFDTAEAVAQLEDSKRDSFLRQAMVIAAVLIVELIALTVIIVGPLNGMTRALRQARATGNLPDLPVHRHDEFGEMASEFNALHGQLREAQQRLQARVDDANEELKSTNLRLAEQAEALKRVNEDLRLLSVTDPLTGLYNMRYFESLVSNELEPAIWRDETHSLLLLRISNLNDCADHYGQEGAGQVLKAVCQRLRARQRAADTLCRLDTGELLLMMRGATMATAISHGDSLLDSVTADPVQIEEGTFRPEFHAGIVTIPGRRPIHSVGELMRCAKLALNSCRQHAGNCIVHYAMLVDEAVPTGA
jgi:diguanylate cyclase (GGDEF)-like protein